MIAQPGLQDAVEAAVADHTAGSPVDENIRWTNRSPAQIVEEVQEQGFDVSDDAVRRILSEELGLHLRQAVKDEASYDFPFRDEQFEHIALRRRWLEGKRWPVLSIDTKKRELLEESYRPGTAYTGGWLHVQDHDFVTSDQRLVPYGVFDPVANEGFLLLATGSDTSEIARDAIWHWWECPGKKHGWHASGLLLLCDCGESNSNRQHRFQEDLWRLSERLRRSIELAHYPPGCSKYNPIEHRLFCHVNRPLAGIVLRDLATARELIARTTTTSGLRVEAETPRQRYEKGTGQSSAESSRFSGSNRASGYEFEVQINPFQPMKP